MNQRDKVTEYIAEQYGIEPEYPWDRYDDSAVFRHRDNRKWFALIMDVGGDKVGLASKERVSVLNLKIDDPILRDILMSDKGIIPAYHMNKLHWITVILDGSVQIDKICDLISESFSATAPRRRKARSADRPPKEWIVPANPKYYDIVHAFDKTDEIDWKQGSGIAAGDIVYIYVGAPVSAILYRCKVLKTDIPYDYQDKNLTIKALMKVKLLKRYSEDDFPLDLLRSEYGIYGIRGPRGIPNSLSSDLN